MNARYFVCMTRSRHACLKTCPSIRRRPRCAPGASRAAGAPSAAQTPQRAFQPAPRSPARHIKSDWCSPGRPVLAMASSSGPNIERVIAEAYVKAAEVVLDARIVGSGKREAPQPPKRAWVGLEQHLWCWPGRASAATSSARQCLSTPCTPRSSIWRCPRWSRLPRPPWSAGGGRRACPWCWRCAREVAGRPSKPVHPPWGCRRCRRRPPPPAALPWCPPYPYRAVADPPAAMGCSRSRSSWRGAGSRCVCERGTPVWAAS